jgi:hypothetical protein
METPVSLLEPLFERFEAYSKTTIELTKLKLLESTTVIATSLIARVVVIVIFSLFMLILSTGIALYLGELLGKSYYGFFIIAAFYLIAGVVLHFFLHKWIKKPVSDLIIKQTLK